MPLPFDDQDDGPGPAGRRARPRRNAPLLLLALGLVTITVLLFTHRGPQPFKTTLEQLEKDIELGFVEEVVIVGTSRVEGSYRGESHGHPSQAFEIPYTGEGESNSLDSERAQRIERAVLAAKGHFDRRDAEPGIGTHLLSLVPWILLLVFMWFLISRQMRSMGGGGVMQFGRSKARMHHKERSTVTFSDVAGIEEARDEVQEIVAFLKNPGQFRKIGARIPRGVLLMGPPGCGKTLLAKAIAGEAEVPFFSVSGSDFVEMFVGVGASRVRDLFRQARESAPCIVFLDEIDAVGRRRGTGLGGGHDEREQTLNQILVEMDGFDTDQGIILLAATNRPDVLDPALLRPGRFDRQIVLNLPDVKGREQILGIHARKVRMHPSVDLAKVARATPGFSGADLEAIVNEAALMAVTKGRDAVETLDLEEARDKLRFGRSRKSMVMGEAERRLTAYHEAGHALMTVLTQKADPLHKVTIIPRGMALGVTMSLPEKDRYGMSRGEILARLRVCFGGRVAEQLVCGDITSGAQNDIEQATELARMMVTKWGMSDKVGPVSYAEGEEHLFLGREVTRTVDHSEAVAVVIDAEIKRFLDEAYADTVKTLQENMDALHRVAEGLLEHETLEGAEVETLVKGGTLPPRLPHGRRPRGRCGAPG
ncbi:MAG: ATP-dependent zinc metalloprotease FtsH, partial [Planctomycetia bacterium]